MPRRARVFFEGPHSRGRGRALFSGRPSAIAAAITILAASALAGCLGGVTGDTVGAGARDFVSDKYAKLTVEVDWMVENGKSFEPSPSVLAFLTQRLDERLNKPGGITVSLGNAITATRSSYSTSDLREVESKERAAHSGGETAAMWIVFATRSADSASGAGEVIGIAYSGSSAAVFAATIEAHSSIVASVNSIEKVTVVHEVGHLLGLVNGGTPMVTPHEDTAHPRHSTNPHSVMYFQVEGTDIISVIAGGGAPDDFDANDIADLQGIGGK
jgi:hypothetical protein